MSRPTKSQRWERSDRVVFGLRWERSDRVVFGLRWEKREGRRSCCLQHEYSPGWRETVRQAGSQILLPEEYRWAFSAHRNIPIVALSHVLNLIQCHVLTSIQH